MKRHLPLRSPSGQLGATVPVVIVAYAMFSILDLGFSKMAFFFGYVEANPILRATLAAGTFEASKIMLTLLVTIIGTALWPVRVVRGIMWTASGAMGALTFFHIFGLATHIAG